MPKNRMLCVPFGLLLFLIMIPGNLPADIYSWVDAKGVRHFSNTDTDSAGGRVTSSPESNGLEGADQAAPKASYGAGRSAADAAPNPPEPVDHQKEQQAQDQSAREALQAKCKQAKERLSTLRFTSLHQYQNAEVERYALEWESRHRQKPGEQNDWRKMRDEDVQAYKKLKFDQELKQAEKEVDDYCRR